MFCSEVPIRDTHKSPKIVCRLADTVRGVLQTWKDTDHRRCRHSAGRNSHIFLKQIFHLHFHMKSRSVFLIILLINANTIYLLRQFQKNRQKHHPRCFCLPISTSLLYVDLRLYAEFVLILLQYRIYNVCKECIHLYRCASDILGRLHGCLQLL